MQVLLVRRLRLLNEQLPTHPQMHEQRKRLPFTREQPQPQVLAAAAYVLHQSVRNALG